MMVAGRWLSVRAFLFAAASFSLDLVFAQTEGSSSVHDVVSANPSWSVQMTLLESAPGADNLLRSTGSDVTALFAPDQAWHNLKIKMDELPDLLENMIFGSPRSCNDLISLVGGTVTSVNGKQWEISVDSNNYPCFRSARTGADPSLTSCIVRCGISASNGIIHQIDSVLVDEPLETVSPSPPSGVPSHTGAPSSPAGPSPTAPGVQPSAPTPPGSPGIPAPSPSAQQPQVPGQPSAPTVVAMPTSPTSGIPVPSPSAQQPQVTGQPSPPTVVAIPTSPSQPILPDEPSAPTIDVVVSPSGPGTPSAAPPTDVAGGGGDGSREIDDSPSPSTSSADDTGRLLLSTWGVALLLVGGCCLFSWM